MQIAQEVLDKSTHLTLQNLYSTAEGKQVLSCIQCGMCVGTCPYGDQMDYPPRRIIQMLRNGLIEEVFESDSLLKCVSCYSCYAKCPRNIQLTGVLLPLIKEQVLARQIQLPAELQKSLMATLRYGNPMGESARKREMWAKTAGLPVQIMHENSTPVDVLWFVECFNAFYPRGQDYCKATVKLFQALGIDFAILGNEEWCVGDCGRLAWEPGLSEVLIEHNMAMLAKYKFNVIVTSDPHAYDAFRFRYISAGFNYPIEHATPFLWKYLDKLKPMLTKSLKYKITYHDSCCLGRHNEYYDEPRQLLQAIPGIKLVEMVHNRINSICCGGGGGGMYLDTYYKSKGMERLSERRVKEAIATGADILAVACPYEVPRFEDALKVFGHEKNMLVKDINELLAESLGDN